MLTFCSHFSESLKIEFNTVLALLIISALTYTPHDVLMDLADSHPVLKEIMTYIDRNENFIIVAYNSINTATNGATSLNGTLIEYGALKKQHDAGEGVYYQSYGCSKYKSKYIELTI